MKKSLVASGSTEMGLTLKSLEKTGSPESRLFTAIYLNDIARVRAELAGSEKESADPLSWQSGVMSLPGKEASEAQDKFFGKSALSFCAGLCSPPEIFDEVAAAARERFDAKGESSWRKEGDRSTPDGELQEAIEDAIKMADRWIAKDKKSFGWQYAWTAAPLGRRQAFVDRAIKSMRKGEVVPWEKLASRDYLRAQLDSAIELWATSPRRAGEALAGCVTHQRRASALLALGKAGAEIDTAPAIAAALALGDRNLATRLSQPTHAWAIKAGRSDWVKERLKEGSADWVNQSACMALSWGPLAAALEAGEMELARTLIEKGASPNAMTETHPEKGDGRVAPLLAVRAAAGDAAGCRLLLAAGADPEAFDAFWKVSESLDTSAMGAAALGGHEEVIRLALSHGAQAARVGRGALTTLARERPEARAWFGKEGSLTYFGRKAQELAMAARESIAAARSGGLKGLLGSKEAKPTEVAEAPAAQEAPKIGEALKEFRGQAAAAGEPKATPEEGLSLAAARARLDALNLSESRQERVSALIAQAIELSPSGRLPANESDAKDLKRLWERNMPRFLEKIQAVPEEERSAAEPGEKAPMASLDEMMEAAGKAMGGMRVRALRQARMKIEAELSVIEANAELSVEGSQAEPGALGSAAKPGA